jgi:hypothetical protein
MRSGPVTRGPWRLATALDGLGTTGSVVWLGVTKSLGFTKLSY